VTIPTTHSDRRRPAPASLLLGLVFVMAVINGPVLYVSSVIEEEDNFVALAEQISRRPEVRRAVANQVTEVTFTALSADEALARLLPEEARPFSVPLTRLAAGGATDLAFDLLDTELATAARDSALREVHRQLTSGDEPLVLDLRAVLVRIGREVGGPSLGAGVAKAVATSDTGRITLAEPGTPRAALVAAVDAIPALGAVMALTTVGLLLGAVALSQHRRRTLVHGGLVLAAGALTSTVLVSIVLIGVIGGTTGDSPVGMAVAEVLAGDLARQQRGPVLTGLALALIGLLLGDRPAAVALRALPRQLWDWNPNARHGLVTIVGDNPPLARVSVWAGGLLLLSLWPSPGIRTLSAVLMLTLAGQLLVESLAAAPSSLRDHRVRLNLVLLTGMGVLMWPTWSRRSLTVALVLGILLQMAADIPAARRLARSARPKAIGGVVGSRRRRLVGATAVMLTLALGALATISSREGVAATTGCNGEVELCDRRVDEVVFAGSHNAMSSSDLGWRLALQTGDMVDQLDHGVRALLIDALYWKSPPPASTGGPASPDDLSDPAAASVIEAALSDDVPRAGTWLCHGFCALGATDLTSGLADIALWMRAHPREVLIIIVQDEISEADLIEAFGESGLAELAWYHRPGEPFPTLGQMIREGRPLLVYAENSGSPDSWLQNAWETAFTETPFTFAVESDFSCLPNRGNPDNPLLLVNHWVTTGIPVREAASRINGREVLLARVSECLESRGRGPTVLATDFVETGDLIETVNELNGVGGTSPPL